MRKKQSGLKLFVFAHPDDESFTCGGTILKNTKAGNEVKLICATRGGAGEVGTPPVCSKEELSKVREKELRNASSVLGISEVFFLDYLDGKLDKTSVDELSEKIFEILKKENPSEVFTFAPNGLTNHPDHIAISLATSKAFEKFKTQNFTKSCLYFTVISKNNIEKLRETDADYDVFGELSGVPDSEISMRVDITNELDKKIEALNCHRTQNKDVERFLESGKRIDLNFEYFVLSETKL